MLEDSLQFCRPLVSALLVGINSRFKDLLGMDLSDAVVKEAVLAAVSHPQFKLKWVPPERRVELVTQFFVDAVVRIATASPLQQDEQQAQSASDDDYGYNESSSAQSSGIISGSNGAAESHRRKL